MQDIPFETIAMILRTSAYKLVLANAEDVMESWHVLENLFPGIGFDQTAFEFINPFNNKRLSIGKLLGRPFFKQSDSETSRFISARANVNLLLNKKKYIESITSETYIQQKVDAVKSALAEREKHRSGSHAAFCLASDELVGEYYIGGGKKGSKKAVYLVFSNDPIDIFMKSTGRSWEQQSCERIGGAFEAGIYSDIEWCNLVVNLFIGDDRKNPDARVMLRTCKIKGSNKVSFGIEPIWYVTDGRIEEGGNVLEDFDTFKLEEKIKEIVHSKGYSMDYESCVTPYTYRGYSDNQRQGRTVITYKKIEPSHVNAREILETSTIELASNCPFCYAAVEWDIEYFTDDRISDSMIEAAFREHEGQMLDGFYISGINVEQYDTGLFGIQNDPSEECPRCGSARRTGTIARYGKLKEIFNEKKKMLLDKNGDPKPFNELPDKIKIYIVAKDKSNGVKDHLLTLLEDAGYSQLVLEINKRNLEFDMVSFFFDYEYRLADEYRSRGVVYQDEHGKIRPLFPKNHSTEAIVVQDKFDEGGDSVDEFIVDYAVWIKEDETDVDAFAAAFAVNKFGDRADYLLMQRPVINPEKYKTLEKRKWN